MKNFLLRAAFAAFGLWLASQVVPGIRIEGAGTLAGAALLLGLVNATVRPILVVLTLPITILTLGLFLFVVNAATFGLVAFFIRDFHVTGFVPALLGSLLVSFISWLASAAIKDSRGWRAVLVGTIFFWTGTAHAQGLEKEAVFDGLATTLRTVGFAAQKEERSRIADQKYPVGPSLGESEKIGEEYRLTGLLLVEENRAILGRYDETDARKRREARERHKKKSQKNRY